MFAMDGEFSDMLSLMVLFDQEILRFHVKTKNWNRSDHQSDAVSPFVVRGRKTLSHHLGQ